MDPSDYQAVFEEAAARHDVTHVVHPDDFIFRFLWENPAFKSKKDAIQYYFNDGANSARLLRRVLTEVCKLDTDGLRLLEFASGYGCVTRHFKNVIPECKVTACDIHPPAMDFIKKEIRIPGTTSATQPEQLALPEKYDAVFALSFFSHMPKHSFARWLGRLAASLKPGGRLIFTTHGLVSQAKHLRFATLDEEHFFFRPDSEQKDLDQAEYGLTVTRPDYVLKQIYTIPNATLVHFEEAFWWTHQDVYVVRIGSEPG